MPPMQFYRCCTLQSAQIAAAYVVGGGMMDNAAFNSPDPEGHTAPPTGAAWVFPIEIASWPRNSRETVKVSLDHYKGNNIIACRCWYVGADGELKPGKGLRLSVKHLPELSAALAKALEGARSHGLVPMEGGAQ
jgi:hypothetical protein